MTRRTIERTRRACATMAAALLGCVASMGVALAQAPSAPEVVDGSSRGAWLVLLVVGLLIALAAGGALAAAARRRRMDAALLLQSRVSDALLRDPTVGRYPIVATAEVPRWPPSAEPTIVLKGTVDRPAIREAARALVQRRDRGRGGPCGPGGSALRRLPAPGARRVKGRHMKARIVTFVVAAASVVALVSGAEATRRAGAIVSVDPGARTLVVEEMGVAGKLQRVVMRVAADARVVRSERLGGARGGRPVVALHRDADRPGGRGPGRLRGDRVEPAARRRRWRPAWMSPTAAARGRPSAASGRQRAPAERRPAPGRPSGRGKSRLEHLAGGAARKLR